MGVKLVFIATVTALIIVYAVELLYRSTVNVAELLASTLDTIRQFILYTFPLAPEFVTIAVAELVTAKTPVFPIIFVTATMFGADMFIP